MSTPLVAGGCILDRCGACGYGFDTTIIGLVKELLTDAHALTKSFVVENIFCEVPLGFIRKLSCETFES